MNEQHKNVLLILTSVLGLLMAMAAVSYGQPPPEAPEVAPVAAISDTGNEASEPTAAPEAPAVEPEAPAEPPAPEEAPAEADPLADKNPASTASEVVADVRSGDWRHAIAGLLVLVMFGLRSVRDKIPWFKGDRGGAALVLGLGVAGGIATALYTSAPLDWRLFAGAIGAATSSVGAYTLVKRILWPKDEDAEMIG